MIINRIYRAIILSLFLFIIASPLQAQANDTVESNPHLLQSELLGRGGSFIGQDVGYLAVLTNPARLALISGEATFFSSSGWLHNTIDTFFPAFISLLRGSADAAGQQALNNVLAANGMGFGAAIGSGYYGDGFGIGANMASDTIFFGRSFPDQIFGSITTDIRATLSLAYSLELDPLIIALGITIEPFYRIHTSFSGEEGAQIIEELFRVPTINNSSYLTPQNTLYGSGIAFHAGLLLELLKQFSIGVSLRDIGDTRIDYSRTSLQNLVDNLRQVRLPQVARRDEEGFVASGSYIFPTDIRIGLAYHPEFDVGIILSPLIMAEIGEINLLTNNPPGFNFLHALHLGAQMTFDQQVMLQVGLNQGQLTFGVGWDSGIFEIYGAWYGRVINDPQKYFTAHGLILHIQFRG